MKSRYVSWAIVAGLSVLPMVSTVSTAAAAQDRDDHARQEDHARQQEEHRYYDSVHHDYHTWNGDEDRRYREFMEERHHRYRDFSRLNKKDQQAYWQWRHDHDDHH